MMYNKMLILIVAVFHLSYVFCMEKQSTNNDTYLQEDQISSSSQLQIYQQDDSISTLRLTIERQSALVTELKLLQQHEINDALMSEMVRLVKLNQILLCAIDEQDNPEYEQNISNKIHENYGKIDALITRKIDQINQELTQEHLTPSIPVDDMQSALTNSMYSSQPSQPSREPICITIGHSDEESEEKVDPDLLLKAMQSTGKEAKANSLSFTEDNRASLTFAVQKGDYATVKFLLEEGADINTQQEKGLTALMLAACRGYTELVELLLEYNAEINIQDSQGFTALLWAVYKGHTQVTQVLLANGVQVNAADFKGGTALMWAAYYGYTEIVKLLLDNGADVHLKTQRGKTAMICAQKNKHTDIVKLLEDAAKINTNDKACSIAQASQENQRKSLAYSVINYNQIQQNQLLTALKLLQKTEPKNHLTDRMLEIMHLKLELLKQIANTQSDEHKNFLHQLFSTYNQEFESLIILQGKQILPQSTSVQNKQLPLEVLGIRTSRESSQQNTTHKRPLPAHLKTPSIKKAKNNEQNEKKLEESDLMLTAYHGHAEKVQLLLDKNPDVNACNTYGFTALMNAASRGHTEKVQLLLAQGADPSAHNTYGTTALMLATYGGYRETVRLLLNKGADVSAQNRVGDTALLLAAAHGHTDIVQLLACATQLRAESRLHTIKNSRTKLHTFVLE